MTLWVISDRFGCPRHVRFTPVSDRAARRIAANIAKLPSVLQQILKDIPGPPNSASRDD